jgi:hypothetical protein
MKLTHWSNKEFWLRAASVLSLLLAAGHSAGGLKSWSPIGESDVLRAMRSFRMAAQGVQRSYLDFYLGFGWSLSVYLVLQAMLLWQIATLDKVSPASARPMIAVFVVANALAAVLAEQFIFAVPMVFYLAIAGCLSIAWGVHAGPCDTAPFHGGPTEPLR